MEDALNKKNSMVNKLVMILLKIEGNEKRKTKVKNDPGIIMSITEDITNLQKKEILLKKELEDNYDVIIDTYNKALNKNYEKYDNDTIGKYINESEKDKKELETTLKNNVEYATLATKSEAGWYYNCLTKDEQKIADEEGLKFVKEDEEVEKTVKKEVGEEDKIVNSTFEGTFKKELTAEQIKAFKKTFKSFTIDRKLTSGGAKYGGTNDRQIGGVDVVYIITGSIPQTQQTDTSQLRDFFIKIHNSANITHLRTDDDVSPTLLKLLLLKLLLLLLLLLLILLLLLLLLLILFLLLLLLNLMVLLLMLLLNLLLMLLLL